MVGTKLNQTLKSYLSVPYWRNIVDPDGRITAEGPFDGKGTPEQIQYATQCAAAKDALDFQNLTPTEIFNLQKNNNIGIECSGLVYNLLNAHSQDLGLPGIYYHMVGYWRDTKRYGVRTVSSTSMALPENSTRLDQVSDSQTGDIICLMGHDSVGHVLFVLKKNDNKLSIVHNSSSSSISHVHVFEIVITNPNLGIEKQLWQETTTSKENFLTEFDTTNPITGIYRPNFLIEK